jgi:hypothetical protein
LSLALLHIGIQGLLQQGLRRQRAERFVHVDVPRRPLGSAQIYTRQYARMLRTWLSEIGLGTPPTEPAINCRWRRAASGRLI